MISTHRQPMPLLSLSLAVALAGFGELSARAGSATADSALGRQDAMKKALESLPAGAAMKRYECRDVVQPLVKSSHACTVYWDPPSSQPPP